MVENSVEASMAMGFFLLLIVSVFAMIFGRLLIKRRKENASHVYFKVLILILIISMFYQGLFIYLSI